MLDSPPLPASTVRELHINNTDLMFLESGTTLDAIRFPPMLGCTLTTVRKSSDAIIHLYESPPPGPGFEPDFPKEPLVGDSLRISDAQNRGDRRTAAHFSASFLKSMKNLTRECIIIIKVKKFGCAPKARSQQKKRYFFKKVNFDRKWSATTFGSNFGRELCSNRIFKIGNSRILPLLFLPLSFA